MRPMAGKSGAAPARFGAGRMRALWLGLAALLVGVLFLISPTFLKKSAAREQVMLPAAVLEAIREIFPQALISEAGMEDDEGVTVFVVEMRVGERYVEVIASPDGVVVEVSIEIKAADVPEAAMAAIRKAAEGAQITAIDTVGTHAEVKDGKLVKLPVPMTTFWAEFEKGDLAGEVTVAPDGTIVEVSTAVEAKDVPGAALAAIQKAAEGGRVAQISKDETRAEPKDGKFARLDSPMVAYWAEFKKGELTGEVIVASDGTVLEISTAVEARDVPEAALAAIRKAADGACVTEFGKDETHAELEGGKVTRPAKAEIYYWAEFQKDEMAGEVSVAPDGTVVEVLTWKTVTETKDETSKKGRGIKLNRGRSPFPVPQST